MFSSTGIFSSLFLFPSEINVAYTGCGNNKQDGGYADEPAGLIPRRSNDYVYQFLGCGMIPVFSIARNPYCVVACG